MSSESPLNGSLDREDCNCPICLEIMVEPVTMPCHHALCLPCYRQTVEKASLVCPMCRVRISSWARKASKQGTLVDRRKWESIKRRYPDKVNDRLAGKESTDDEVADNMFNDLDTQLRKIKELSQPGEIKKEYEAALKMLQRQKEEERKKEEEASAALIRSLQEQEELELQQLDLQRRDLELMDRRAAEELDQAERLSSPKPEGSSSVPVTKQQQKRDTKKVNCPLKEKPSLTLNSFFSPMRRTATSAPPNVTVTNHQRPDVSPYPYACISPKDKIFYGLSYLDKEDKDSSSSDGSDVAPGLQEHSYTTASAKKIDLTKSTTDEFWAPRSDVETYDLSKVKTEPFDIFAPGPSGVGASGGSQHQFQPISCSPRTPPRQAANGAAHDPQLIKSVPRHLLITDFDKIVTETSHSRTSESNPGSGGSSSPSGAKGSSKVSGDKRRLLKGQQAISKDSNSHKTAQQPISRTLKVYVQKSSGDISDVSKKDATRVVENSERSLGNGSIKILTGDIVHTAKGECGEESVKNDGDNKKDRSKSYLSYFKTNVSDLKEIYKKGTAPVKSQQLSERKDSPAEIIDCDSPQTTKHSSSKNILDSHGSFPVSSGVSPVSKCSSPVSKCSSPVSDCSAIAVVDVLENDENKDRAVTDSRQPLSEDVQEKGHLDESAHVQVKSTLQESLKGNSDQDCLKLEDPKKSSDCVVRRKVQSKLSLWHKKKSPSLEMQECNQPEDEEIKMRAGGKRRLSVDSEDDCVEIVDLSKEEGKRKEELTQEEKDHMLALELQNMYAMLDKQNIKVDRFKGAQDEYSLRRPKRAKR